MKYNLPILGLYLRAFSTFFEFVEFRIDNTAAKGIDIALEAQEKYGIASFFIADRFDDDILHNMSKINYCGYLIRPYNIKNLEATLRLALAQVEKNRKVKKRYVDIDGHIFDMKTMALYNDTEEIKLSKRAKSLLYYLSKYHDQIKTYEEIINYVYDGEDISLDALRHLVKRVRESTQKDCIVSIKGVGYKLSHSC